MASNNDKGHSPPAPAVKFNISYDLTAPPDESMAKSPSQHNDTTVDRSLAAFTPILTSKGDQSRSLVLLSPSRTITETLTALAESTGHQLEQVWDEVGYSPEDRASQLSDLLVKFRELCELKIAEEKSVAETFEQTIDEAKDEIRRISAALKTLVDPYLLKENTGQTLTDELATLEAALEGLRSSANAARDDLKECRDYLVESYDALGIPMDPKWQDIESDLTAERREEFHRKRSEMKEEVGTRMAAVMQLVRDCQNLMADLKMEAETEGTAMDRRIAGSLLRSEDGSFIMASKFRSDTCIGISSNALEDLTKRAAELHSEKRRRKMALQEMGAEIAMLWEKLQVPEEEQLAFTQSVKGLGLDTIKKGRMELERLKIRKAKMLGRLIQDARKTIVDLWEQIDETQDYRSGFAPFAVRQDDFNFELLDKHEEYIAELNSRLEQMGPILRIIQRREIILQERMDYEELQKDSERLKQREAAMTRQLMEEEKMARRIKRDLPRLTDALTEKLLEWKEKHGTDFKYHGETYFKVMERQDEEWSRYKADELQRKQKKKQDEACHLIENRFGGSHTRPKKKTTRGPLGDAQPRQNSRPLPESQKARLRDPRKAQIRT